MACFVVPATEAIVTTIAAKAAKKREGECEAHQHEEGKLTLSQRLKVLNGMLWGGSGLLAFEHMWHGEIAPWAPFLTNMASAEQTAEMLHEMATAGTAMAVIVTAVWAVAMAAVEKIRKSDADTEAADLLV